MECFKLWGIIPPTIEYCVNDIQNKEYMITAEYKRQSKTKITVFEIASFFTGKKFCALFLAIRQNRESDPRQKIGQ